MPPTTTTDPPPTGPGAVQAVLRQAQELGFLGDGPVEAQVAHAAGFAGAYFEAVDSPAPPPSFLDLGSGGGLPGLVLASHWPDAQAVFVDAHQRRTEFLAAVIEELGWAHRARVVRSRAEALGRQDAWRGSQMLVVARSFGAPAVTAECAAPLMTVGGLLVVSEPPPGSETSSAQRWPAAGLELLGLRGCRSVVREFAYQVMVQEGLCPDRYPRREGVPTKRPLF